MTEQIQPKDNRTKAEILASEQAWKDAASKTPSVAQRETFVINKKKAKNVGALAVVAGASILGTAFVMSAFGSGNTETTQPTSGPTSTPETSQPTGSAKPTSPEATSETNSFVKKETQEGWTSKTIELNGGAKLEVDTKDLKTNESTNLMKGAVISGDISMDGTFLSDSDALTGGLYINNKEGAVVLAPYNASAYENFDPSKTALLVETIKAQMEATGCGLPEGCEVVNPVVYETDGTVHPYDASTPSTNEATPSASASVDGHEHSGDCGCAQPTPTPEPTPSCSPMPSETPTVCPDPKDIEKAYKNWKVKDAPVVAYTGRAIFQSDGAVDGKVRYDSETSTALITVVEDTTKKHNYRFDFGGDLQEVPVCVSDASFLEMLNKDIAQTLARKDISSVKVVYVNSDGIKSKTINE